VFAPPSPPKTAEALERYAALAPAPCRALTTRNRPKSSIGGAPRDGFTDEQARVVAKFRAEFDMIEKRWHSSRI
jgi:hypothetical protein